LSFYFSECKKTDGYTEASLTSDKMIMQPAADLSELAKKLWFSDCSSIDDYKALTGLIAV